MSVMIIDSETYVRIANDILGSDNMRINVEFANLSRHNIYTELNKLNTAVYQSYSERYNETAQTTEINFNSKVKPYNNMCKVVKALQAIKYQIEIDNFDYSFADKVVNAYTLAIVEGMQEYEEANWG